MAERYQQRFNRRLYDAGPITRLHRHLPERVRMWSPWWLRHVVAVERTLHDRTMDELRNTEAIAWDEQAIERAAEALCAWPAVKQDEQRHETATHMATTAIAAAFSGKSRP